MTVPSETSEVSYTGDGLATNFPTGFYFQEEADLRVVLTTGGVPVTQTLGVHYTVTMPANVGDDGTVVMLVAPAAATTLTITRDVELTQLTSLRAAGPYSQAVLEDTFDRQMFAIQELDRRLGSLESAGAVGSVVAGDGCSFTGDVLNVGAGDGISVSPSAVSVVFTNDDPLPVSTDVGLPGVELVAARWDHTHEVLSAAPLSSAVVIGNAAGAGAATTLARSDHQHEVLAGVPVNVTKAAAAEGVSTAFARSDHKHDVTTAAAVSLTDATNAEGAATTLARSDHTHSHGARGGGSLHAVATGAAAGFMAAADKTYLDVLADLAHCNINANTAQTFAFGVAAVVQFNDDTTGAPTLFWDPDNLFNTTTYNFTSKRDGYYFVSCNMRFTKSGGGAWTAGDSFGFSLYKNGATFLWEGGNVYAWAAIASNIDAAWSSVVWLAAGDTLEVRGAAGGASNWNVNKGYLHINELP